MKVAELVDKFNLTVFGGADSLENEIKGGYSSDLLSDVMGNASEGDVWITLQSHINVIAVASLNDLAAVILVSGHKPQEDALTKSNEEGIPLLGTDKSAFEITGLIYNLLKEE
jgi:predicted transcriptional regulator